MRNRMQDLDFEQTVAFDSVKDFEFTRKAAQKFRLSVWIPLRMRMQMLFFIIFIKKWNWFLLAII